MDAPRPPTIRKCRHAKRLNPLLPKRPKKPMTSYGAFLRNYFRDHPVANSAEARTAMGVASAVWRSMGPEQRATFDQMVAPAREHYNQEMTKWTQQKNLLKRPPSVYGMFLKDVWEREKASGRRISTMGTYAAGLWRGMSENEKNVYRRRFEFESAAYRTARDALLEGEVAIESVGDQLPDVKFETSPPPSNAPEGNVVQEVENVDVNLERLDLYEVEMIADGEDNSNADEQLLEITTPADDLVDPIVGGSIE